MNRREARGGPGRDRSLIWDGCLNVRDLGGHPTEDGGETVFGAVVRADSVHRLTDHGWRSLVAYGIRTVVDLRLHDELAEDPPRDLPVDCIHVPVLDGADRAFWERVDGMGGAAPDVAAASRAVYLEFLGRFQVAFATSVTAVARAREGGVLVHCVEGRDRTGLVAALLLRLAGVGLEDVGRDYALSRRNLAPRIEPWIAEADDERERVRRVRISATPADGIVGALATLEQRHGGVWEYLRAGGAEERDLDGAQARLRS